MARISAGLLLYRDGSERRGDTNQRPGGNNARTDDSNERPGGSNPRPGDRNARPGDSTERPGNSDASRSGDSNASRSGDGDGRVVEVFVAHMGGPFWRGRERAWTIPKGEVEAGEDPRATALREFEEEIGVPAPAADYVELGTFRQSSAKSVVVFAARAELDIDEVHSNTVTIELPRGSGHVIEIPEVDDARWARLDEARGLVIAGQVAALDALEHHLA